MEMLYTILYPLLFLLAGGLLLPALWNLLFGGKQQKAAELSWETKLRAAERDLENARADLREQKNELEALRADLANTTDQLKEKESALAAWEANTIDTAAQLNADLQAKDAEVAKLKAELAQAQTDWAAKLNAAEASVAAALAAAQAAAAPAAELTAELATLKASLADKDGEIRKLLARVAELAPLGLQLKDRDLRLKNLEAQISVAAQNKDDEIARLTAELAATAQAHAAETGQLHERIGRLESNAAKLTPQLDSLRQQLEARDERLREADNQLFDLETRYRALEKEKVSAIAGRDNESQKLKLRLGELEATAASAAAALAKADAWQPDFEAKLRDLEAHNKMALGEKDAEVARLRLRIAELERADVNGQARLAELETSQTTAAKDKDAAIALLQLRLKEMEPLTAQLAERDRRLKTLEAELNATQQQLAQEVTATVAASDNEIAQLKRELDNVGKTKDAELRQLHERINAAEAKQQQQAAALDVRDTELAQLRAKLGELADLNVQLNNREAKLSDWETRYQHAIAEKDEALGKLKWRVGELEAFISNRDEEIGKLKWRINALEALGPQLAERDARLAANAAHWKEHEAQFNRVLSDKDHELGKLRWRVGELEASADQYDTKLSAKDGEIAQLRARLAELDTASAQAAASEEELLRSPLRLNEPEALSQVEHQTTPKPAKARAAMDAYRQAPPQRDEYDDLKLIHGIGPALEKLLHKLGIYFFKQIAAWDAADIDYVDAHLERFKGRIRQENWVDSAKEEHFKKYGVKL